MPPDGRDTAYLLDMLESARRVREHTAHRTFAEYGADWLLRSAVERALEVIGEAARHVSAELRVAHPEIPWREIVGQRNILAHDYGSILNDRIWIVVEDRLPDLIEQLEKLVPEPPEDPMGEGGKDA